MNKVLIAHFQKADQLSTGRGSYQAILDELFAFFVSNDHVENDATTKTFLPKSSLKRVKTGVIVTKSPCIVAGIEEVIYLAKKHTKLTPKKHASDGEHVSSSKQLVSFSGLAQEILRYERVFLNILQRMSGIATETVKFVEISRKSKHPSLIAATRKTPWMHLDKKAVAVGGGVTHRLDLRDGVLLKDNHLEVLRQEKSLHDEASALSYAIEFAKIADKAIVIEVEVKTDKAAFAAIASYRKRKLPNPFIILLDNYTPKQARRIIKSIRHSEEMPKNFTRNEILRFVQDDNERVFFEASGGITSRNIGEWVETGVDVISVGSLTHSPKAVDLSLDII